LDADINALSLKKGEFLNDGFAADAIFIGDFYPELLTKIRSIKKTCLIGNPGTTFQFYYLARDGSLFINFLEKKLHIL
jgi:hypothetical protein